MAAKPIPKRNTSGLVVVIFLGIVFFILLGLLLSWSGRRDDAPQPLQSEKLTVLSVAPIIAHAIKAIFEDGSVSEISGGLNDRF